jgi:AraC-like DNA-binding protein
MNVHDSERIAGLLDEAGYAPVADGAQPDVVVFSTCAVLENGDNNLGHLKPVKDRTPGMQIAVGLRRMFSALAGMPLSEYVRRRRMTVAAAEVVTGIGDLLGIAVRYGYGSAEAFGRAFQSVHGVSQSQRMAKLIYSMITSLDGYAEAAEGDLGTGPRTRPRRTIVDRHRDLAMASRAVLPRCRHRRQWRRLAGARPVPQRDPSVATPVGLLTT